jgi:Bacterial dnaA protein helix-turn-helix
VSDPAQQIDRPYLDFAGAKPLPLAVLPSVAAGELPPIPLRNPDQSLILDCCCQSFDVTREALRSADRHRNLAEARVVAYWLLRTLSRASSPEIGQLLNRDHTSALTGVKSVERRRAKDETFRAFTDELAAAVSARLGGVTA